MQLTTPDGHVLPLRIGESTLGRGLDNTIVVSNISVSRRHACIRWDGATLYVSDSGSANGTWMDGRRLPPDEWRVVPPGATILFGEDLYVQATDAPGPAYAPVGTSAPAVAAVRAAPLPPTYAVAADAYGPGAVPPPGWRDGPSRGGLDLLLAAVDVSLTRGKLAVALGGSVGAGIVLGLALLIAARIISDGPVLALLFAVLGAILAWLILTLTVGTLTRMSLNDLGARDVGGPQRATRPAMGVRDAFEYGLRRLPEFAVAPLALVALVGVVVLAEAIVMLVGRIDVIGELIVGLLFVPAVVLNLFLMLLVFFGASLLFPIIVDRGRGVIGSLSYLLALLRRAPGKVVFYLGLSIVVTWLATLLLWMLVLAALSMTTGIVTSGMGAAKAAEIMGASVLGQAPFLGADFGSVVGMFTGAPATYAIAGRLLQLGMVLTLAVAFAYPLVLQVAMGSAVYLNVRDDAAR